MENNWHPSIENLLKKYCEESMIRESLHRNSYYESSRLLTYFQLPIIIISAINGSLQFLSKNLSPAAESLVITVTGSTSILVSIITSIMTYLKLGQSTAQHCKARIEWLNFYNHIRYQLSLAPKLRMDGQLFLADIKSTYEKLFEISPICKKTMIHRIKNKIKNKNNFNIPTYLNGFSAVEIYETESSKTSYEENTV